MSRALSTVLDVAVFLLLVSAAATTLTLPTEEPAAPDAEPARTVVATSTASVNYSLSPGARAADPRLTRFPRTDGPEFRRHAHGSLGGLLGEAAVRNASIDGRLVTHTATGMAASVGNATAAATGPRTHVRATWRPFRGSSITGKVAAGTPPPADATVAAETLTVDSGVTERRTRALRAANRSGFEGVARVAANATVRLLVPADGMRLALHGDYPVDRLAAHRYRRLGRLLDANVSTAVVEEQPRVANDALRDALAGRFEAAMRAEFDTPQAAARAVRAGEVRVVVRRWSA